MFSVFCVFGGLGSESIFSAETLRRAGQDALAPECKILLQSCYQTFHAQISDGMARQVISSEVIDLDDFAEPITLVRPSSKYHHNVLVQHTALYLQQAVRHIACMQGLGTLAGSTGFCAGLLPAAAAATSGSSAITLISRFYDFFQVALWVGVRSESYRRDHLTQLTVNPSSAAMPCSYVVDGLSRNVATQLINDAKMGKDVFVSAVLSPTRITLSGTPSKVSTFVSETVPVKCRARAAEIFSLYHSGALLKSVRDQVLEDLSRCGHLLNTELQLAAPLLSTVSGDPLVFSSTPTFKEIANAILDMIFIHEVDWDTVQKSIASLTRSAAVAGPVSIVNYGPGLGMSTTAFRHIMENKVDIINGSELTKLASPQATKSRFDTDDIAIVGMAVDFPGATDANVLWEGLMKGMNSCTEIPTSRFDAANVGGGVNRQGEERQHRGLKTRYGNFLKHPFLFDNEFFGISRRETKSMDPQQRILLQTSYRALEDAGYVPDLTPSFSRDTFGCWIGNATLDYVDNLRSDIDVYYSTGTLRAFLSARISYAFGWSGPSITLDTACSSSIVAMHQAARSILAGDCRTALVGAANTITSPDMYLGLDRAHFLSPSGQCKAFDASADGYCRAEGCGAFIIKRLSDAIAEGDRIHAVIKAVEINQSGNTHSITHPHAPTQEALFRKLIRQAEIDPNEVSVAELHGTGTQAGDPSEVESVRRVLCKDRATQNPLHLTSIKANIGHAEAASGIAGLAKIVLMIRHGRIPPQISLKALNPRIRELRADGAVIDQEAAEWPRLAPGAARIGMLNNFGAGGSNAALIISEHLPSNEVKAQTVSNPTTMACGISAKSERAIARLQDTLAAYLVTAQNGHSPPSLADVCATLTSRRQMYDYRVAVAAHSLDDLAAKLRNAVPRHVVNFPCSNPAAVFTFSGQGSQYLGMGRELMELYSDFANTVRICDRWLVSNNFPGCLDVIQADSSDSVTDVSDTTLWQAFQSGIFVLEVAIARLLLSWGIKPVAVVGHSLGEYAALVTAGVLELFDGLKLVARRASLMMERCELGRTSMLAVNCNTDSMRDVIDASSDFAGLTIACSNSEMDCVIGGNVSQLSLLKRHLAEFRGIKSKLLDVPLAFHTPALDPIIAEFTELATREVHVQEPKIPVVSNALARTVLAGEQAFSPEYFPLQCRSMVAFCDGINDYLANTKVSAATWRWIEIGPHPTVQPMLRGRLMESPITHTTLPVLKKNASAADTIAELLRHFYETSVGVNWRKVFSDSVRPPHKFIDLPGMPFFPNEFLVPYRRTTTDSEGRFIPDTNPEGIPNSFAAQVVQRFSPGGANNCAIYETPSMLLKDFIKGHLVCGLSLCPASVYHEMVLAALADAEPEISSTAIFSLSKVTYSAPFIYDDSIMQVLRVVLERKSIPSDGYDFTILSYVAASDTESRSIVHCQGVVKNKTSTSMEVKFSRLQASTNAKIDRLKSSAIAELGYIDRSSSQSFQQVFSRTAIYDKIFTRVVTYSEPYQKVQLIRIDDRTGDALATCAFPEPFLGAGSTIPASSAIFMDVLLHVAGFVANMRLKNDIMGICKEVGTATVLRAPVTGGVSRPTFDVYCSTIDIQDGHGGTLTLADVYALDSAGPLAMFKGMVFQHVKMARINQALSLANRSRRKCDGETLCSSGAEASDKKPARGATSSHPAALGTKTQCGLAGPPVHVRDLVANVCGLDAGELGSDSQLDALGIDSLMTIELESELALVLGIQTPQHAVANCATVGDIESLCEGLRSSVSSGDAEIQTPVSEDSPPGTSTPPVSADVDCIDMTKIIADICGAHPGTISLDSELSSLGVDSLLSLELADRLQEVCGGSAVSSVQLQVCRTVGDIEKLVQVRKTVNKPRRQNAKQTEDDRGTADSRSEPMQLETLLQQTRSNVTPTVPVLDERVLPLVVRLLQLSHQPEKIQSGPPQECQLRQRGMNVSPLFLIHDGSGICTQYHRLGPLGRRVMAIHDPKFLPQLSTQDPWPSLSAMASHYADIVSSANDWTSAEDCLLGGWSFGGVVAFEAARILMARGHGVKGVVLIDSPPPVGHIPLTDSIIRTVTESQHGEGGSTKNGNHGKSGAADAIRKLVQRSFRTCANLLGAFNALLETMEGVGNIKGPVPRLVLLRCTLGWAPPPGYGELIMENPWLQDRRDRSLATAGWEMLTGSSVPCVDIPGNHFQVFDTANIEAVSDALSRVCLDLDSQRAMPIPN